MTLKDQLMEDMKNAMRAHETLKLDVVRMIRNEIKTSKLIMGKLMMRKSKKSLKPCSNNKKMLVRF